MRSTIRGGTFAATFAVVLVTLAGCGAGTDPQTALVEGPPGTNTTVGDVAVRNLLLVGSRREDGAAALVVGLVNTGTREDRLIGVTLDGAQKGSTLPPSGIVLPVNQLMSIGSALGPQVTLYGDEDVVVPGRYVPLRLTLENSGQTVARVLVQAPKGPYATVTPVPPPAQAPAVTPVPSPTRTGDSRS